jgi:hypothetical protein
MTPLERAANAIRELWLHRQQIPAALQWDQLKASEQQAWIDRAETALPSARTAA